MRNPCCLPGYFGAIWIGIRLSSEGDSMLMLIAYDVNTSTPEGERRLRKVAKICEHHGMRVQNSVFEVFVDAAQFVSMKAELSEAIDEENDSVRFYRLGNSYQHKIETMGKKPIVQAGNALMF